MIVFIVILIISKNIALFGFRKKKEIKATIPTESVEEKNAALPGEKWCEEGISLCKRYKYEQALTLFEKAAEKGSMEAALELLDYDE